MLIQKGIFFFFNLPNRGRRYKSSWRVPTGHPHPQTSFTPIKVMRTKAKNTRRVDCRLYIPRARDWKTWTIARTGSVFDRKIDSENQQGRNQYPNGQTIGQVFPPEQKEDNQAKDSI